MYEQTIQPNIKKAVATAKLIKPGSTHTLCHSFVIYLLEAEYDIPSVQGLLGQEDATTTLIYRHVLNRDRSCMPPRLIESNSPRSLIRERPLLASSDY